MANIIPKTATKTIYDSYCVGLKKKVLFVIILSLFLFYLFSYSTLAQTYSPRIIIRVFPESIKEGQSAHLVWTTKDISSCNASGGWNGDKEIMGYEIVSPPVTSTYTLTCVSFSGEVITESVILTVANNKTLTQPLALQNYSENLLTRIDNIKKAYECAQNNLDAKYRPLYPTFFEIPKLIKDFEKWLKALEILWFKLQNPEVQKIIKENKESVLYTPWVIYRESGPGGISNVPLDEFRKIPGYKLFFEEYDKAMASGRFNFREAFFAAAAGVISRIGPKIATAANLDIPHYEVDYHSTPSIVFGLAAVPFTLNEVPYLIEASIVKFLFAAGQFPSAESVSNSASLHRFLYFHWQPFLQVLMRAVNTKKQCQDSLTFIKKESWGEKSSYVMNIVSNFSSKEARGFVRLYFTQIGTVRSNYNDYFAYLGRLGDPVTKAVFEAREKFWNSLENNI